ncbi:hypothetical protein [Archangium sp.]|uniref:hypothetical protein n=1 Tax=Archangium sp. TaxID=1872627 RepID=UPI00286A0EEF|nr:hypothetical protein [Archangium sp.]
MSQAGNIKGGRGTFIGPPPSRPEGGPPGRAGKPARGGPGGDEKTRTGGPPPQTSTPTQTELPRAGGPREEKTQIGRPPTQPETPQDGFVFGQDGLEERGEPRPTRTQDNKSGVFEAPRSTGERPALKKRPSEGTEGGTGFEQRPPSGTGERPQLPTRRGMEAPRQEQGPGFEKRPTGTGERPRLETPPRGPEVPMPTPGGPRGTEGAEARPLEELVPEFPEPIGEEALAHHFAEELRYLGAELRPARMAPSTRAERLWAFFRAYAEANAKDPAGQSAEGRELFRKALNGNGFAALRDANSGRNGVQLALAMLEAKSPEELHALLAEVHIEPGPSRLSSEVSIPVQQHTMHPETSAVVVDPSAFEMPKEARPKEARPKEVPAKPVQAQEAQPKDTQAKDTPPKEVPAQQETQPKEAQAQEARPQEVKPQEPQAQEPQAQEARPQEVKPNEARPTAETPERPATPKKAAEQQPVFDQKEKLVTPPLQTGVQPPIMGMQGTIPTPLSRVDEQRRGVDPREELEAQRGKGKRLGSQMFWNVLHRFRDGPEFGAVEQENFNRLAYGTMFAVVAVALLVALLVSL